MDEKISSAKGYFILTIVFAAILIFTILRRFHAGNWFAAEVMSDFMGAFFVVFGMFKLLDLRSFADAYATYDFLAAKSRFYAMAYPLIQLGFGVAYLIRFEPVWTSGAALILMLISSAGVAKALFSGRKIRCACLGTKISLPMTTISFLEDALMFAMAASMLWVR